MLPYFWYHPATTEYDFGPRHPLKPERMRRTLALLDRFGVELRHPGEPREEDVLRCHAPEYVNVVRTLDPEGPLQAPSREEALAFGFGSVDNPPFAGMWRASLAYTHATVRAAETVRDGAPLAFGLGGGLHHALRARASGFCIFDDPAIALAVLLERFDRVAYVDIDVHHGDGVQWIWYDDPRVLTVSIHESGKTLYPGSGFVEETGAEFTSLNLPLPAKTTGDVWLEAFERVVPDAIERFRPGAIVLQMGTDPHFADPLGHLLVTQQEWLGAVRRVRDLGLPIVAVGGGGYNMTTVPRMWASACLTLGRVEFDDRIPEDLAEEWGVATFSDPEPPLPRRANAAEVDAMVGRLRREHLPNIPSA